MVDATVGGARAVDGKVVGGGAHRLSTYDKVVALKVVGGIVSTAFASTGSSGAAFASAGCSVFSTLRLLLWLLPLLLLRWRPVQPPVVHKADQIHVLVLPEVVRKDC